MTQLPHIVVVGGSYVGVAAAQQLSEAFHGQYKTLLIEKNSHFQHLFAFPRFAIATGVDTHKAFIPYTPGTFAKAPPGSGAVVRARAAALTKEVVQLDKKVLLDGIETDRIPYSYLVIATGTKLTPPSTLPGLEKLDGVTYLGRHAAQVKNSSEIVIIGGGAVGIQSATDIKELYPDKSVTLVHSRMQLMPVYHHELHDIVMKRLTELNIATKLGSRAKLPQEGYPTDGRRFEVTLENNSKIPADFVIVAIGQTPQSDVLRSLTPQNIDKSGFIRVLPTMQIDNPEYPNIYAIGDVAATPAHKAAKPGNKQAALVVQNIKHLINHEPLETYTAGAPAIHMTLGIVNIPHTDACVSADLVSLQTKNVIFGNAEPGSDELYIRHKDDGRLDMGIDDVWRRRGGGSDFNL